MTDLPTWAEIKILAEQERRRFDKLAYDGIVDPTADPEEQLKQASEDRRWLELRTQLMERFVNKMYYGTRKEQQ